MFTQTFHSAWQEVRHRRSSTKDKTRPLDLDEFPPGHSRETVEFRRASPERPAGLLVDPQQQQPQPQQQQQQTNQIPASMQQQPVMIVPATGPWSTPEFVAQNEVALSMAYQEFHSRSQYLESINGLVVLLQQDVATKANAIASLLQENSDLRERLSAPQQPSDEVKAIVASLETELTQRKANIAKLEEMNHDLAMQSVDRAGEIYDLKKKLCASELASARPSTHHDEIVRMQAELDRARAAVSWIESKNTELAVDLSSERENLRVAQDERKSLKIANSKLLQSFEYRAEELKRATEELEQLKAAQLAQPKSDNTLASLKDKVAGLTEKNKELKTELSTHKQQLVSTLEECKLRDRVNKESARRVDEQNSRIAFLQRQVEEANAKVTRLQQERTAKVGAINQLWEKAVETAADIEATPDIARMHVELVLAKEELTKSQSHCQTLMTLNRRLMSGI
jgi:DNA repair exonuclease SbcCD ATPase subunit